MSEFVVLGELQDKLPTVTTPVQAQISVRQFHMFLQPAQLKNFLVSLPGLHKQSTGLNGTNKAILGKVVASHVFRKVTGNNRDAALRTLRLDHLLANVLALHVVDHPLLSQQNLATLQTPGGDCPAIEIDTPVPGSDVCRQPLLILEALFAMGTGKWIDASVNSLNVLHQTLTPEVLSTLGTRKLPFHVLTKHVAFQVSFATKHFPTAFFITGHTRSHASMNPLDMALVCCCFQCHGTLLALDATPIAVHALLVLPHLIVVDKVCITFVAGVVAHFQVNHSNVVFDVDNQLGAFHIRANCPDLSVLAVRMSPFHVVHQSSYLKDKNITIFVQSVYSSCTHFFIAEGTDLNPSNLHTSMEFLLFALIQLSNSCQQLLEKENV